MKKRSLLETLLDSSLTMEKWCVDITPHQKVATKADVRFHISG
jgi:hypothetical protein